MSSLPASATVQLSRGGADDLDSVIAIMNAAFDAHYGEAWTRSQCAGILPMTGVELVLARVDGGATAGFSLHRTIAGESQLLLSLAKVWSRAAMSLTSQSTSRLEPSCSANGRTRRSSASPW